ncbi:MAG: heme-binding protein [Planctomycetota bacterium]
MFLSALLSVTLALPAAPALDEAPPEPPSTAVLESAMRQSAVAALRGSLAENLDAAARVAELAQRAVRASVVLGDGSEIGRRLHNAAANALAAKDRPEAGELLLDLVIGSATADLAFEPIMEAPLPEGWPWPVPAGEIRVQRYPEYRLARSGMSGRGNGAFFTLFRHIQSNDIAMTAPVEMTMDEDANQMVDMGFLYRRPTQGDAGEDGRVLVENVDAMWVLSIGVRGSTNSKSRVDAAIAELDAWFARSGGAWERAGAPRVMGYNGPSVPNSRKFMEIQIPVRGAQ